MTREEIIALARKAGFSTRGAIVRTIHSNGSWVSINGELERFAALVAAHEREECAKVVESSPSYDWHKFACESAAAIRARGSQDPTNCQNHGRCAHPFCSCGGTDVANA